MRSPYRRCAACLLAVASAAFFFQSGCRDSSEIVFGVTSELVPGVSFTSLDATARADGDELFSRTFEGASLSFPMELPIADLPDGANVELDLVARQGDTSVLRRIATTTAVGGRRVLYEVALESECIAVDCTDEGTCIEGACADAFTDAQDLPEYYPTWAGGGGGGGVCDPGGEPEVLLGYGQSDFHDVEDGDVLQVEAGPQGGYHVWIAARLKNLSQSGSLTTVSGTFVDLDYAPSEMTVIFTFDPDEGDYCKVYGLRFRLDDEQHPIETLLGKTIAITISISDPEEDTASATRTVKLSDETI